MVLLLVNYPSEAPEAGVSNSLLNRPTQASSADFLPETIQPLTQEDNQLGQSDAQAMLQLLQGQQTDGTNNLSSLLLNPSVDPETGLDTEVLQEETTGANINDLFAQADRRANTKLLDSIEGTKAETISRLDKVTIEKEGIVKNDSGKHIAYKSKEGGNDTIGHGHKLTDAEVKSGKINGIDYTKGLTDKQSENIYLTDKKRISKNIGLENKSEEIQFLAYDVAHRAGNIEKWKFTEALRKGNLGEAYAQLGDFSFKDTKGNLQFYNKRNKDIFKAIGYEPTLKDIEKYNRLQKAKKTRT